MAARLQQLKSDVFDLSTKILQEYSDIIRELQFEEEEKCLRFEITDANAVYREVSICFSEDYPEGTAIYGWEGVISDRMKADKASETVIKAGLSRSRLFGRTLQGGRFLGFHTVPQCLALCEVVPGPELRKNNDIWVLGNADLICTRFFIAYDTGYMETTSVDCEDAETLANIREAVDKFRKVTTE